MITRAQGHHTVMDAQLSLTPIQTDIHLDESLGTGQSYGIGAHWRLPPNVDAEALRAAADALGGIVAPLLDAVADSLHGRPACAIAYEDVSLEAGALDAFVHTTIRGKWDATRALVRVARVRLPDQDVRLVVASHHIVLDGDAILALSQALVALATGRTDLAALQARQSAYADLAEPLWRAFDTAETLQFWKEHADALLAVAEGEQALDEAEPTALYECSIPDAEAVSGFCRRHRITPAFYFKCLFGWLSAQLYGLPRGVAINEVRNHRRPRLAGVLGSFSSYVPFVITLGPAVTTFAELLADARAFHERRRGFELLSQFARKHHGLRADGLHFVFNFHDYARRMHADEALTLVAALKNEEPQAVSIDVYAAPEAAGGPLRVRCAHPGGTAMAEAFARSFLHVHQQLVRGVGSLAALSLVPEADRTRLDAWNRTDIALAGSELLHARFEAQVDRTPAAIAVIAGPERIGYDTLNRRANQLAHYLRAQGVRRDTLVGLYVERSPEMLVGILGILKAGAAYLPLDPDYPTARLAAIVEDAAPRLVLTQAALSEAAAQLANGVPVLALDGDAGRGVLALQPNTNPSPEALGVTGSDLCYVMYTSGSTGKPKGVMVAHRGVANRLAWTRSVIAPAADDVMLQKTPFGFDVSVWELMWAHQVGAPLVLAKPGGHRDPSYLGQLIADEHITIVHFVPSMLRLFIDSADLRLARGLRHIVCSGEALSAELYHDTQALLPHVRIWNFYGPTEASIEVTYWEGEPGQRYASIPIGKPIHNTKCYVLNPWQKRLPIGLAGELCLGGVGVARGYHGRPDLTAERFVPDPYSGEPGARMYRTGDVVRYRADGQIAYLGRLDDQVKIRGLRIELGEIEARLCAQPGVREAAVIAHGSRDNKRLVAYVCPRSGSAIDVAALRAQLGRDLPDYMVPSAFLCLPAMPLTASGKLDRKALPSPDDALAAELAHSYEAPEGALELGLARIWAELLGLPRVGRRDKFFELGGHSLLAVRLTSRVARELGVTVPLSTLLASPTLADLAQSIARAGRAVLPPIARAPRDQPLPVSFAQQRLWFLAQFEGGSEAYHVPGAMRLRGTLNRPALRAALDAVVARHESLRTHFAQGDGELVQVVADGAAAWQEHDLRALPAPEQAAEVARHTRDEAREPFDLTRGPLIRARLLRLADDLHLFLVTQHHIVSDGWSLRVLVAELGQLYRGLVAGKDVGLPPLPIQYADYAAWQRSWLTGERLAAHADYWHAQLAGAPALLELPTDRPRPAQQDLRGAAIDVGLDDTLAAGLRRLCRAHDVTPFMALLAAWSVVLSRLSGQGDIVIGAPSANRNRTELEGLIGFFVNALPLRVELGAPTSLAALLAAVRRTVLAAQDHQELPFEQIVERVRPPRRLAHTPIFQVMLAWEEGTEQLALDLPHLAIEVLDDVLDAAKFDLELTLSDSAHGIRGRFGYATALYDQATVARHWGYLERVLAAMVRDASQPAERVDLLGAEERALLLTTWNDGAMPGPERRTMDALVDDAARARPEAPAVVQGDFALSYADLVASAAQLARQLVAAGVQPHTRVALCTARRPAMVVALLAIWKAGAAYLPLDPAYPSARLAELLDDAAPSLLLTDAEGRRALASTPRTLPELAIDDCAQRGLSRAPRADAPEVTRDPEGAAYVIYTSGSTGKPKGVVVEHRALVARVSGMISRYGLCASDRALQFASFTFDASIEEIFPTLASGATLVLHEVHGHGDSALLWKQCRDAGITILNLPTRFFEAACVDDPPALPVSLRLVIIGGEAAREATIAGWLALRPAGCRLLNTYGPTEAVVTATSAAPQSADDYANIGRALPHTRIYLLDALGQPVPLGAPGELYIGGACLARGYLGRPELTAERFVVDPFVPEPDARMYRSGDVARFRADGSLEFVGRADSQVKIRGFRVELGEIETRLAALPGVREAVVVARAHGLGQRLVAYVTGDAALSLPALRQRLASQLPEYMVPAAFVKLDALPLTTAGKLQHGALPPPAFDDQADNVPYEAPRGALEAALAAIWCEVLDVARVGRHANFFELGGHSLLAMRALSRVRRIAPALPLQALFEHPSVAALAAHIGDAALDGEAQLAIPVAAAAERHTLSLAQQRLWFLDQLEPQASAYNMTGAVRMVGRLDTAVLERAFAQVVARHDTLRTRFFGDAEPRLEVLAERPVPMLKVDLHGIAADARDAALCELLAREAARPFALDAEPLLRVALIALGDAEHVLLINMHHIISDGWSVGVLIGEVCRYYDDGVRGLLSHPRPLRIQYGDYAAWQRQRLTGAHLGRLEAYWRERLGGPLPSLQLPEELPASEAIRPRAAELTTELAPQVLRQLTQLARDHDASLFMVLLSGLGVLLHRLTGQDDLIVGAPVAGRTEPETEALIGCLLNVLALRLDLGGQPSFAQLLERVRDVCLGAYEHQDLPFEKLIELVRPERRLAHNPLFDVLLNVVNLPSAELTLEGLTVTPVELDAAASKFALTLYAEERAGALALRFVWQRERFASGTMEALAHQLVALLAQVAADASQAIGHYSLVCAHTRGALPAPALPLDVSRVPLTTVPALFRSVVAHSPNAVAILHRGQSYSYRALADSADAIAASLRTEDGLALGERVVITGPRSFGVVAALLGVLQAGGVLVLLDQHLPDQRRREILAEAGGRHLICVGAEPSEALREAAAGRVIRCVDPHEPMRASSAAPSAPQGDSPEGPAYVFFTSGTTGKPKGIVGQHQALAHFVTWQRDTFAIGPGDRSAQLTGLGFDVVMRDILTPLASGATLCLLDEEEDLSAGTLFPWFERLGITMFHVVPTVAKSWLLDPRAPTRLPALRRVFFAGEPLPATLVRAFRSAVSPDARIINLYGPTETTLAKAYYEVPAEAQLPATMPVGRPMTATELLVLNATLQPCGVGEPGEVVIRTRFPSLGYLHTGRCAPQFIANPFRHDPHDLLYFTGDLGYIRHDGVLCLTGRRDDQVKIRGMRVELGEVHAALVAHPGIREAALLAFDAGDGDKRIAAYYVAGDAPPDAPTLQAFVKRRLPDYMVPSVWIAIDALPMTANGKLDRRRLPAPELAAPLVIRGAYVAPESPLEAQVAEVWQQVLGRGEVGVHDNFFELGGHSLLLLQVRTRLQAALAREFPVVALFEHPTVAAFARYLSATPEAGLDPMAHVADRVSMRRNAQQRRRR